MNPGSDMPCGCASSVTVAPPPSSCASTLRRVASASAANTRFSCSSLLLTIWFSISESGGPVKHRAPGYCSRITIRGNAGSSRMPNSR